ncbi:predicted protein [Nematostella vectensis]|uniref:EGF-like domain-containing protein n=1 Tax=Nematostella vectensis TaxID=45351 RepID=A7SF76_NEMVE|nr:predicted protein [Nematostella vectensis]|eukprot:XP_001629721.1 predicted protein [Nematostella vectensis]
MVKQNGCSSSPCPVNTTCVPGPTQDTHTCACPSGYTGVDCENDVDECSDGQSPCHVSANCSNTLGSFTCTCKDGFTGDGLTCKG